MEYSRSKCRKSIIAWTIREQKFQGAQDTESDYSWVENVSSREQKFQGAKILGNEFAMVLLELLLQGANRAGRERLGIL